MSKLIDSARAALAGPPPLTPADIEGRLEQARTTLSQASADHQRAALDAEAGFPGAAEELAAVVDRRRVALDRIATLESALVAARDQAELASRKIQAKLKRDNLAKIASHLEKRDKAAERLAAAIRGAVDAWGDLVDESRQAALPIPGVPYPAGSMTSAAELSRAVQSELYRVGAVPTHPRLNFPGGVCPDLMMRDQPEVVPALVDVVRHASAHVNSVLQGDTLEPVR